MGPTLGGTNGTAPRSTCDRRCVTLRTMIADEFVLAPADPADAGEILVLQRAAYVTEAQIYGEPYLSSFVQTFEVL